MALFGIPASLLPEVKDSSDDFGHVDARWLGGELPIAGVAGDQQAALVGQACFTPGMGKSTYGTGCFMIVNTGESAETSRNRLLTTVAYRLNGKPTYAMEGSIFVAGATVQWLRDGLRLFADAAETGGPWHARRAVAIASTWYRPLPDWAHPTGTPRRAVRSSG